MHQLFDPVLDRTNQTHPEKLLIFFMTSLFVFYEYMYKFIKKCLAPTIRPGAGDGPRLVKKTLGVMNS